MSLDPIFVPITMEWKHPDPECAGVEVSLCTIYDTIEEADSDLAIVMRLANGHEGHFNCAQAAAIAHALLKAADVLAMQCVANAALARLANPPSASGAKETAGSFIATALAPAADTAGKPEAL